GSTAANQTEQKGVLREIFLDCADVCITIRDNQYSASGERPMLESGNLRNRRSRSFSDELDLYSFCCGEHLQCGAGGSHSLTGLDLERLNLFIVVGGVVMEQSQSANA